MRATETGLAAPPVQSLHSLPSPESYSPESYTTWQQQQMGAVQASTKAVKSVPYDHAAQRQHKLHLQQQVRWQQQQQQQQQQLLTRTLPSPAP